MTARLWLACFALALTACQSRGPTTDFDPTRRFSAYHNWQWAEPAVLYRPEDPRLVSDLTGQRIRDAIAEQLQLHGLRPATEQPADLRVQAWLLVEQRQQQVMTQYGGSWGTPWHGGYWGPAFYESRNIEYRVATLQLDLSDATDGKLVWRGSTSWTLSEADEHPAQRAALYREKAARILAQYPPN